MTNEVNFIHPSISKKDIELFGFTDAPNCFHIEDDWLMAHVMHLAGVFPSVGIARKSGWNKPIPKGFWQKKVGKKKIEVSILNEFNK